VLALLVLLGDILDLQSRGQALLQLLGLVRVLEDEGVKLL
jgi:hypothetical protein